MFVYEKKLQYPVKIAATNPKLASLIISQYLQALWRIELFGTVSRNDTFCKAQAGDLTQALLQIGDHAGLPCQSQLI